MSDPILWDVFCYFDEPEVLEVRCRELDKLPIEVKHVGVEAELTLAGEPKVLYSKDLPRSLASWVLWEKARLPGDAAISAWVRETCQRDFGLVAAVARGAQPSDLLLFGDVDEIPSAESITRSIPLAQEGALVSMRMNYHSLLATWRLPLERDVWNRRWPVLAEVRNFDLGLSMARGLSESLMASSIGGWHLSSMGGPSRVLRKLEAYAHHDESWIADVAQKDRLYDLALRGRDVADRFDMEPATVELPECLLELPYWGMSLLTTEVWK